MRKLLALPFLPHERIITAFTALENKAETSSQAIQDLVAYIDVNWIRSTTWPPSSWSVFMQAVHTNNDVEGWHRRLNKRAVGGQVPLYVLVPLLHREAKLVSIQMKLVSEGKLSRYHRRQYRTQQARLFNNGKASPTTNLPPLSCCLNVPLFMDQPCKDNKCFHEK